MDLCSVPLFSSGSFLLTPDARVKLKTNRKRKVEYKVIFQKLGSLHINNNTKKTFDEWPWLSEQIFRAG